MSSDGHVYNRLCPSPTTPSALRQAQLGTSSMLITCRLLWQERTLSVCISCEERHLVSWSTTPTCSLFKIGGFFYPLERMVRGRERSQVLLFPPPRVTIGPSCSPVHWRGPGAASKAH